MRRGPLKVASTTTTRICSYGLYQKVLLLSTTAEYVVGLVRLQILDQGQKRGTKWLGPPPWVSTEPLAQKFTSTYSNTIRLSLGCPS